jgi:hypothetical protein
LAGRADKFTVLSELALVVELAALAIGRASLVELVDVVSSVESSFSPSPLLSDSSVSFDEFVELSVSLLPFKLANLPTSLDESSEVEEVELSASVLLVEIFCPIRGIAFGVTEDD